MHKNTTHSVLGVRRAGVQAGVRTGRQGTGECRQTERSAAQRSTAQEYLDTHAQKLGILVAGTKNPENRNRMVRIGIAS